jgi:hypothetical protein
MIKGANLRVAFKKSNKVFVKFAVAAVFSKKSLLLLVLRWLYWLLFRNEILPRLIRFKPLNRMNSLQGFQPVHQFVQFFFVMHK